MIKTAVYKSIRLIGKFFYPKFEFVGQENLPDDPCIVVGNHAQAHGPFSDQLYYPRAKRIWCTTKMMHIKDVPSYAFQDFWSKKPPYIRWLFKIASYIMAPLCVCVFTSADTIEVFRGERRVETFADSVKALNDHEDIIIHPECPEPHNNIVNEFQRGFVDIAEIYYRETGKVLSFVPLYHAPAFKKVFFGKPIRFDPTVPIYDMRNLVCEHLMNEITAMAEALPPHRVTPYPNIPKSKYPMSK